MVWTTGVKISVRKYCHLVGKGMAQRMEARAAAPWIGQGNLNTHPEARSTAAERDNLCIDLLRSRNVSVDELKQTYTIPRGLDNQDDVIKEKNLQLCAIYAAMGQKRRTYLQSWLLGGDSKQEIGDRKGIINMLADDASAADKLFEEIKRARGRPVKMPKVFMNPPDLTQLRR